MNYSIPAPVSSALAGKRVFLTGCDGFLGRHFEAALKSSGAMVAGWDTRRAATEDIAGCRPYGYYDYVIHAAGLASPVAYRKNPLAALKASTEGTENVLKLAERCLAKVLFCSSSEIYGNPYIVPTPETYIGAVDTLGDRSCYDVGKCVGETLCHIYADRVQTTIVRIFNAFGPGMRDDDMRFMPSLRQAKREKRPVRIYGSGKQTRTFCFVSDTIRGCLQALVLGKPDRAYNIGAEGPELSMIEVAQMAGVEIEQIEFPDEWPSGGEPQRRCPDISRAKSELGYAPMVKFSEGLAEFLK